MDIDKLILAVVQREDAEATLRALNQAGLAVTVIASRGGFLRASNVTLLIGLRAAEVEPAVDLLKTYSRRRTVRGPADAHVGATIFVLAVERYVRVRNSEPTVDSRRNAGAAGTMKMIITVVSQDRSDRLVKTLTDWSYRATVLSTTGAFSRSPNATLLTVVRSERVDSIVDHIRQVCAENPTDECGVTSFVVDAPQSERM